MKSMIRSSMIVAALVFATISQAATWKFDTAHSGVSFSVKHMMISTVRGNFNTFDGSVQFDEASPQTFAVEATAEAASIDTRNEKRDAHLRSADFFEVEKYPQLTFKSKSVEKVSDGLYKLTGDLSLHGVTKEVVFDVEGFSQVMKDARGDRTGAVATAKINRSDYGLNWNKALEVGGVVVSDEVNIILELELIKQNDS